MGVGVAMHFSGFVESNGRLTLDHKAAFRAFVRRLAGEEVSVTIHKRREKRSDRQNRALHAMLTPWSHGEGYPMDELKRDLLIAVFGSAEVTSPITGEVVLVPVKPHTSKLTIAEFAELMERSVEIAAGCGVQLELPNEYRTRKKAEAKQKRRAA
jgi:hypothetical protein